MPALCQVFTWSLLSWAQELSQPGAEPPHHLGNPIPIASALNPDWATTLLTPPRGTSVCSRTRDLNSLWRAPCPGEPDTLLGHVKPPSTYPHNPCSLLRCIFFSVLSPWSSPLFLLALDLSHTSFLLPSASHLFPASPALCGTLFHNKQNPTYPQLLP